MLFEELAGLWREKFMGPPLAPATVKRKTFVLEKHLLPALGSLSLEAITPAAILDRLLRPLEARGLLETALRARELAGAIFRFGIASALTDKDPTFNLLGAIKPPAPKHHPGITDPARLGEFLRAVDDYRGNLLVRFAWRLLPLVFVRPGELIKWRWEEIDRGRALWTIPAPKMKMRLPHVVPLARQCLDLLGEMEAFSGPEGFLFPNMRHRDRPMSENTLNAALRAMGFGPDEVVAHGFRTTASTLLNERGYRPDLIERQLAHVERNAVRGAYNRAEFLEERRAMMADWADYLDGLKAGGGHNG
jgi:integrase